MNTDYSKESGRSAYRGTTSLAQLISVVTLYLSQAPHRLSQLFLRNTKHCNNSNEAKSQSFHAKNMYKSHLVIN